MQRLKELRKSKGLYQKDVASFLGIDRTTYVKWETNKTQPDHETLNKLATFFDVSVDYLLERTDVRNASDSASKEAEFLKEFDELFTKLSDEQRKLVISQMKWLLDNRE